MEDKIKEEIQALDRYTQLLKRLESKKKKVYTITLTHEEIQTLMEGSYSDVEAVIDNILDQYQKQVEERQQH